MIGNRFLFRQLQIRAYSHDMCPDPTDPEINTQNKAKLSMKQRQKDKETNIQTVTQIIRHIIET